MQIFFRLLALLALLFLVGAAQAAQTVVSVSVVTGAYPTASPAASSMSGKAAAVYGPNVDTALKMTSGDGVLSLLCYATGGINRWLPVAEIILTDALYSEDGNNVYDRWSPGSPQFSHCLLWEKDAGGVYVSAHIISNIVR